MAGNYSITGKGLLICIISFLCISNLYNHSAVGQDVYTYGAAVSKPSSISRSTRFAHKVHEMAPLSVETDGAAPLQAASNAGEDVAGGSQSGMATSIIRVPGDYPTIQAAIDHAANGDIIAVYPGIYTERVIITKYIILRGANKNTTIIDGTVDVGYDGMVNISGFTIENSLNTNSPVGIHLDRSTGSVITNNIIKNNKWHGIFCDYSSGVDITDNVIEANGSTGTGTALFIRESRGCIVTNNTIKNNKWRGISVESGSSVDITGNLIEANDETGLFIDKSEGRITTNIIKKNRVHGIYCQNSSNVYATDNLIASNDGEGAAFINASSGRFTKNIVMGNSFGGVGLQGALNVQVSDNLIEKNKQRGMWVSVCNDMKITRNEITGTVLSNTYGEGLYVEDSVALISDNVIKSNAKDGLAAVGLNSIVETIDNTITDNNGNGMYCENGVIITGCCNTVAGNGVNYSGCAVSLAACPCPVGGLGDMLLITPASVLLPGLGVTSQLTAIVEGSNGATLNVTEKAAWSSSNPSVVAVDNKGLVAAVGEGEAEVCAEYLTLRACAKAAINTTHSGINQWTQSREGQKLGIMSDIAIDPRHSNMVYAATQGGKIFKSVDNGQGWTDISYGLRGDAVNTLRAANKDVLFAGAFQHIYCSWGGGLNWYLIAETNNTTNLVFDSMSADTIYAGSDAGMSKSVDGGKTWAEMNTGLTYTKVPKDALVMNPLNPEILYVIARDERLLNAKVFKTTNGGERWHEIGSGLPGTARCLAIDALNPKALYVGTEYNGIFKTTNAGATWQELSGSPHENNLVIKVDPKNSDVIYVGNGGGGVYESRDGGASWRALFTQLTNHFVRALAINPKYPTFFAGSNRGAFRYKDAFDKITARPNDDGVSIDITFHFNTDTGIEPLGFNVYRSTSEQGDFEKITNIPLGPSVTQFHDPDFLDGATHVYKMTVVDAKGETLPSFTCAATPLHKTNPDYAVEAAEAEKSVAPGGSVVFPLTISSHDNFDEDVTFEATDLPTGVTAAFTPTNGVPPLAVTMNVSAANTTLPGSYDITVKAKGDGVTRTKTVRLHVGTVENKVTQMINATGVTVGKAVEITGETTPATIGTRVATTFVSPDNNTSSITADTDANGRYSVVRTFEKNGIWKITTAWEEGNTSSQTDEVFVAQTVMSIVMATDATPQTEIGERLMLKGKISPNPGGGEIFLEVGNLDGSIQLSGKVTVSPEGEFSQALKVVGDEAGGDIRIYARFDGTDEYGPSERTIFVPIKKPPGMAIIVAGGGNAQSNKLWEQTNTICNYVYTVIKNQGISDDLSKEENNRIWYLHPDANNDADNDGTADTDAKPTRANLQKAIQEWAADLVEVGKDAKKTVTPITVYLMGPGESDKFMINKTETVTAKDLSGWLNKLFTEVKQKFKIDTLPVNVIVESPQSGSFIDDLKVKDGVGSGRVVVTSTDDGSEDTGGEINVMGDGAVSFSKQFFYGVKSGRSIGTAWADANLTIQELFDNQNPRMDADGDGIPNEAGDEIRGRLAFINQNMAPKEEGKTGTFAQGRDSREGTLDAQSFVINQRPIVTGVQKDLTVEKQTATLWAKVSDADDAIEDLTVQGLLFPPKGKEPVELQLAYSKENDRFEINTDGFALFGLYTALFVAKDKQGNASRIGKTAVNSQSIVPVILKGIVSDSVTKLPIDGAVVAIEGGYGNVTTTNGGLYLIQLPAGVYTISANKKRYAAVNIKDFTVGGNVVTKNIELTPKRKR